MDNERIQCFVKGVQDYVILKCNSMWFTWKTDTRLRYETTWKISSYEMMEHTQFVSVNVYPRHVSCITRSIFYIDGILPKGPYPPCFRMADRALLAGLPRYMVEWGLIWKRRSYLCNVIPHWLRLYSYIENRIWVRSRNSGCLVTWFCYQLIAKPGNKAATVS